jgi:hypothetical protein
MKFSDDCTRAWVVLDMKLVPRGSGNRRFARKLAASFKRDPDLKPFISKVVTGTSRVTVHVRAEVGVFAAMARVSSRVLRDRDVPGQLKMFPA